ncbi:hypothetical protein [Bartonella tamiae]|uniref:hypothetical protein n=1 Tax=Bartonella tamiae TaxID=373638 RepID=UPI0002F5E471|nr:hypothetical protein [Bartonella tamiae]
MGNHLVINSLTKLSPFFETLPEALLSRMIWTDNYEAHRPYAGCLIEGNNERI